MRLLRDWCEYGVRLCSFYRYTQRTRSWLRSLHTAKGKPHEKFILYHFLFCHCTRVRVSVCVRESRDCFSQSRTRNLNDKSYIQWLHALVPFGLLNEFHFTARSNQALFLFAVTITELHTADCILVNYRKIIIGSNAIAAIFLCALKRQPFSVKAYRRRFWMPHRT